MSAELRGHLSHIEINVADLNKSAEFWGWLLGKLGYEPYQQWEEGRSWRLGGTYFVIVQVEDAFRLANQIPRTKPDMPRHAHAKIQLRNRFVGHARSPRSRVAHGRAGGLP